MRIVVLATVTLVGLLAGGAKAQAAFRPDVGGAESCLRPGRKGEGRGKNR